MEGDWTADADNLIMPGSGFMSTQVRSFTIKNPNDKFIELTKFFQVYVVMRHIISLAAYS